jgi:hypothetical protein
MKFGAEVICLNDDFTDEQKAMIPHRPVKDRHYHIDEILITRRGRAVTLVELDNPPLPHPSGLGTFVPSFDVNRFAEIEEAPAEKVEETEAAIA